MSKQLSKKQLEKRIDELNEAIAILGGVMKAADQLTEQEFILAAPIVNMYLSKARRIVGEDFLKDRPEFKELHVMIERAARVVKTVEQDYKRKAKLAQAKPKSSENIVMQGTKCSRCNKRPAKFGEYCGRCAEELGIRERGKI